MRQRELSGRESVLNGIHAGHIPRHFKQRAWELFKTNFEDLDDTLAVSQFPRVATTAKLKND